MKLTLVTPPVGKPITYDQFSAHARLPDTNDRDYCLLTISDAVAFVEDEIDGSLMPQTWSVTYYAMPTNGKLRLPKGPVQSIVSIYAGGLGGTTSYLQNPLSYDLRAAGNTDYVYFLNLTGTTPLTITYIAGYPLDVYGRCQMPADLRRALLIQTSQFYEFREGQVNRAMYTVDNGLKRIYERYRRTSLIA